jgi:hypothetical protein
MLHSSYSCIFAQAEIRLGNRGSDRAHSAGSAELSHFLDACFRVIEQAHRHTTIQTVHAFTVRPLPVRGERAGR